jgi:hypothetical protein
MVADRRQPFGFGNCVGQRTTAARRGTVRGRLDSAPAISWISDKAVRHKEEHLRRATPGLALHFINEAFRHCKAIGAAAKGVDLLLASNIGDPAAGTQASEQALAGVPGLVVDRTVADARALAQRFIGAVAEYRHFARQQKERVPA